MSITLAAALAPLAAISAPPPMDIDAVAGVYKNPFDTTDATGKKSHGEDVLEIVKTSPTSAYFRTHLEFGNGNVCGLYGIADVEGNELVYHAKELPLQRCVLKIKPTADGTMTFEDVSGACAPITCGPGGGYSTAVFAPTARHKITYMSRLTTSNEYKAAVKEHDAK